MGFYDDKHYAIGAATKAGWRSEIERNLRFTWAESCLKYLEGYYANVVDAGCADGALFNHLHNLANKHYIGVDTHQPFIDTARRQFPHIDVKNEDILQASLPSQAAWVALGVTVGNHHPTSLEAVYRRALELDAAAFVCAAPNSDSYDEALRRQPIPEPAPGWVRTPGPRWEGEILFVDAPVAIPTPDLHALFVRAEQLSSSTPGERAALAARLGLHEVVARLAATHPNDDLVQAAKDFADGLK